MAELRCPMCGKPNPAEREVCQFCNARLKPLHFVSPPDESPSNPAPTSRSTEAGGEGEDPPDWLSSLRPGDEPAGSLLDGTGFTPGEAEDDSDWSLPEEDASLPGGRRGVTDWLAGLRGETAQDFPDPAVEAEDTDQTDASPDEAGEDDWLGSMRSGFDAFASQDFGGTGELIDDGFAGDDQEWLTRIPSLDGAPEEDDPQDAGREKIGPPEAPQEDRQFEETSFEDVSDWLASLDAPTPPEAAPTDGQNAGLEDVMAEQPSPSAPDGAGAEEPDGAGALETPDWMAGLRFEMGDEWDDGTRDAAGEEPGEPGAEGSPTQDEAGAVEQDLAGAPALAGPDGPEEDDLAWLHELGLGAAEEAEVDAAPAAPVGPAPQAGDEPADERLEVGSGAGTEPGEPPPDETALDDDAAYPDFSFALDGEPDYTLLSDEDLPEWLAGLDGEAEPLAESLEKADAAPNESGPPEVEEPEALAQGELPRWMDAMRPVADAAATAPEVENEDRIEHAGPLAGLRSVLPAEPDIAQTHPAPVVQNRLRVTDAQRLHAELWKEILENEGRPRPRPERRPSSSQIILRLLIALALLGAVIWALLSSRDPQDGALEAPAPAVAAYEMIDRLPEGAPVLLGFDYEPGWAPEIDPAASVLLEHLAQKNARLALVSTNPAGPLLGERLVRQAGETAPSGLRFVNLGYIPFGTAGLLTFAQDPRQVTRLDLNSSLAWESDVLEGVSVLDDFALVAVFTQDPGTARYWIEQAEPYLETTPLVMAVSAQAEPLVLPYFYAVPPQVQGVVSGLAGARVYAGLAGSPNAAGIHSSALSYGLVSAGALIVAGGVFQMVSSRGGRRKHDGGGEE